MDLQRDFAEERWNACEELRVAEVVDDERRREKRRRSREEEAIKGSGIAICER